MIFLIVVILVLALIHGYVGFRIIPSFQLSTTGNFWFWCLVVLLTFLPLIPALLRYKGFENSWIDKVSWAGYFSLGFFSLAFLLILGFDLLWIFKLGLERLGLVIPGLTRPDHLSETVFNPQRRIFIRDTVTFGLLGLSAGLSVWGLFEARRSASIFRISVPIENLPPGLEGLRIVQLSDIHVGPTIKRDYVQRIADQAMSLNPDILVMTGDLVDGSVKYLQNDIQPLKQLQAPMGKYFVTGNHEYYSGVSHWIPEVQALGFIPLINEHRIVTRGTACLTIAGITDFTARQMDPENKPNVKQALAGSPNNSIKLLLAHQPGSIDEAARNHVDLQLSGHTHGGQFIPFNWVVKQAHPYIAGLYTHHGTWIYVNRGTGYWGPPLRLGVPSEITILTLINGTNGAPRLRAKTHYGVQARENPVVPSKAQARP
ncbi:MAG: metallophosphoesterase [FCB group bacterium]|nr:metallophosphoesterase [FCB group bacterium]